MVRIGVNPSGRLELLGGLLVIRRQAIHQWQRPLAPVEFAWLLPEPAWSAEFGSHRSVSHRPKNVALRPIALRWRSTPCEPARSAEVGSHRSASYRRTNVAFHSIRAPAALPEGSTPSNQRGRLKLAHTVQRAIGGQMSQFIRLRSRGAPVALPVLARSRSNSFAV